MAVLCSAHPPRRAFIAVAWCAFTVLAASRVAAQQGVTDIHQRHTDGDKEIVLPETLRAIEDLAEVLQRQAGTRLVCHEGPDWSKVLTNLRVQYAGQRIPLDRLGNAVANLAGCQVRLEGRAMILRRPLQFSPRSLPDRDRKARLQGLRLIASLTDRQVSKMYLNRYLPPESLSEEQRKLYCDLLRGTLLADTGASDTAQMSDREILNLPVKFLFAYTSSFRLAEDGKGTYWLGLVDHGRGIVGY